MTPYVGDDRFRYQPIACRITPSATNMQPKRSRDVEPEPVGREEAPNAERPAPKQIYLRTVYPLNPGIPHFIDMPGSW